MAYAGDVPVANIRADFDVESTAYRVHMSYQTAGAVNLFFRASQDTNVEGRFTPEGRPVPTRFFSSGVLRGAQRVTQIDYRANQPNLRQLIPPNEEEREAVSGAQQLNTIDALSAMADLIRRVNTTGQCDGRVTLFDGRRLAELEAHTAGHEKMEQTSRSSFMESTLRCDFTGRQLAGFRHDATAKDHDMQHGSAWFASPSPGGALIPVRITFRTKWFGDATMYLASR